MSRANVATATRYLELAEKAAEQITDPAEAAQAWAALAAVAARFEIAVSLQACADRLQTLGRYVNQGRSW